MLANALAGGAIGAAGQVANNKIDGKEWYEDLAKAAGLGVAGGGLGSYVGDKVDAARRAIRVSLGDTGNKNIAAGIAETTASAIRKGSAVGATAGEQAGAIIGGVPSVAESVANSAANKKPSAWGK